MKRFVCIILTVALLCVGTTAFAAKTYKIGGSAGVENNTYKVGEYFCEIVTEALNGEATFEWYGAEQMGNDTQLMENMQVDLVAGACMSFDNYAQYAPDLNIMSMAFAFQSIDHMYAFLDSDLAKPSFERLEGAGFKVLTYRMAKNPRGIYTTKKPVATVDDMKGLKIRIPNIAIFEKNFAAMGAMPTITSWAEYPFALLQGVVDGGEGAYEALVESSLYESVNYASLVAYAYPQESIVMSMASWNTLTPEQQAIVQECADKAAEKFTNMAADAWAGYYTFLEEKGLTFVDIDRQSFVDKVAPLAGDLEQEGFWQTPGLYESVQALAY